VTVITDPTRTETVEQSVAAYLANESDASRLKADDVTLVARTSGDFVDQIGDVIEQVTRFVTGIAVIALVVVGAIGIANIMLVSVTERTREIGIMKAVGARNRDVMQLFLFEAALLGLAGSAVGVPLGLVVGWAATRYAEVAFALAPFWTVLAVAVGVVVASSQGSIRRGAPPASTPLTPCVTSDGSTPEPPYSPLVVPTGDGTLGGGTGTARGRRRTPAHEERRTPGPVGHGQRQRGSPVPRERTQGVLLPQRGQSHLRDPGGVELVGGPDAEGQTIIAVVVLQSAILEVIAGPDEDSQSVVSVLHDVRETGRDPTVDEVRSALRSLVDKGVVETVKKTVPTVSTRRRARPASTWRRWRTEPSSEAVNRQTTVQCE